MWTVENASVDADICIRFRWIKNGGIRKRISVNVAAKSMCNPKDNLVRMIRTMFGIGTIHKCVVSVLEVEVKLNLIIVT